MFIVKIRIIKCIQSDIKFKFINKQLVQYRLCNYYVRKGIIMLVYSFVLGLPTNDVLSYVSSTAVVMHRTE